LFLKTEAMPPWLDGSEITSRIEINYDATNEERRANWSPPFRSGRNRNVIGDWLPFLTSFVGGVGPYHRENYVDVFEVWRKAARQF